MQIKHKQNGATLIICMVLLSIVTIIGAITMRQDAHYLQMSGIGQAVSYSVEKSHATALSATALSATTKTPFDESQYIEMSVDANGFGDLALWHEATFNTKLSSTEYLSGTDVALKPEALNAIQQACPRSQMSSSADIVGCEFYLVRGRHRSTADRTDTVAYADATREIIFDAARTGAQLNALNQ